MTDDMLMMTIILGKWMLMGLIIFEQLLLAKEVRKIKRRMNE